MHSRLLSEYVTRIPTDESIHAPTVEKSKQLYSNPKPPQLSLHAFKPLWTRYSVEQVLSQSHTVERRVHTQHQNEQKVLIQLSNTSWELHPGRRKKNTMSYMCVHVGLQWYKIHIKYKNNICRINTVQILHIQHTLEQCHMNNRVEGEKGLEFSIWLPLTCLISDDLENLAKRSTHNYVSLMHEKAIPALASKTKWVERIFLLTIWPYWF